MFLTSFKLKDPDALVSVDKHPFMLILGGGNEVSPESSFHKVKVGHSSNWKRPFELDKVLTTSETILSWMELTGNHNERLKYIRYNGEATDIFVIFSLGLNHNDVREIMTRELYKGYSIEAKVRIHSAGFIHCPTVIKDGEPVGYCNGRSESIGIESKDDDTIKFKQLLLKGVLPW